MTVARKTLICLSATPWYHVVNRCVRRAYLCGTDQASGQSYEHRRAWIADRIKKLAAVFAIDVAAYAVMSNHYHLVLRVDVQRAQAWSGDEVLSRWTKLFQGTAVVRRHLQSQDECDPGTCPELISWVALYRQRLTDISWFMRVLNESVARKANAEDGVGGRFWEGRFKSQALLDKKAILTAMVYVDLNPVRARMATTPEDSEYTSISERAALLKNDQHVSCQPAVPGNNQKCRLPVRHESCFARLPRARLMPFDETCSIPAAIPFAMHDYFRLVETAGRQLKAGKRGRITVDAPPLLVRLGIDYERFLLCATTMMKMFATAVGTAASLDNFRKRRNVRYLRGIGSARLLFGLG
ncbi:MAG: transposase [Castellaniella sp.]